MKKTKSHAPIIILLIIIFISLLSGVCAMTVAYKKSEANSVIIYYQGFKTPYIEYRLANSSWNPKIMLDKNNEIQEFTHKIVIPLEGSKGIVAKFSDGKGNVLDNEGKFYEFKKGSWLFFENGAIVPLEDIDKFSIVTFETESNKTSISKGEEINLSVNILGGTNPFYYKFTAKEEITNKEIVIQDFKQTNSVKWIPEYVGNYKLSVIAKDSTGREISKTIENFNVYEFAIEEIKVDVESPQYLGTTITLDMSIVNSEGNDITCYYEIDNGNSKEIIEATAAGKAEWNPEKIGKYTITGFIKSGENRASKKIEYVIEEKNVPKEAVTIHYQSDNTVIINYVNAMENEDYATLDFNETTMTLNSRKIGYNYKFEIEIPNDEVLIVWFEDNEYGTIDDNNGNYYVLHPGEYGIKENQIYNLTRSSLGFDFDDNDEYNDYEEEDEEQEENQEEDNGRYSRRRRWSIFN